MEGKLLMGVEFDVMMPTRYDFVCSLCTAGGLNDREAKLALYLTELSLLDHNLNFLTMSSVAAAAVHLARQVMSRRRC